MPRATTYVEPLDLWVAVETDGETVVSVDLLEEEPDDADEADEHPVLSRIVEHIRQGGEDFADVDVAIQGASGFRRAVLQALRDVPPGETVTYGELAEKIGKPGAARAVGEAVAANPAAIVVPCHRVVRADGTLGGYSGGRGTETKRRLLEAEGAL